ncbi:MAG TPA: serpin family protein [Bacillota bacterium]|nr:serpin family protein [Bacillota bacterium]
MNSRKWKIPSTLILCGILLFLTGCKGENQFSNAKSFSIDDDVTFDDNDYQHIVEANNQLGTELLTTIEADEQNNRFISPVSLFSALSMAYMGSDGETKQEIAQTMHIGDLTDEEVKRGHASLYEILASMPEDLTLHHANALWIDHLYSIEDDYSETLNKYYNATFQSDDFSKDTTAEHINDWIEEQTEGHITDMVNSPIDSSVVLFLINTLYFQGDWTYPFETELTQEEPFQTGDGEVTVPMMTLSERLRYTIEEDYEAVVLPYGDGEISFNLFLPTEGDSVDELAENLQDLQWKEWHESLSREEGTLRMPAFEMDFKVTLNEPLQQMGIQQAFDDRAEFPHMITGDETIAISNVLQKSKIIVDESGTEAASSTSIEMDVTSAPAEEPFQMNVDRPFLFTITENTSGIVLFMGTVHNPDTPEAN